MDLLKWLLMLPWRVLRGFARLLGFVLRPLLGDMTWSAPGWMRVLGRYPRRSAGSALVLAAIGAAGWFGWQWYQHRPQPQKTTFYVTAPAITDYSQGKPVISPLSVVFTRSAAPIEQVDKTITQGITMDPAVSGRWTWTNDHTLTFEPTSDWPVGQRYAVRFDARRLVAPQVLLAKDDFDFQIAEFSATAGRGEFYQDPQNASVKQVIQELRFNYPVAPAALEKRVSMAILDDTDSPVTPLKFSITYDKEKLRAWIHSEQLPLPHDPGELRVQVDAGVVSSRGGAGTSTTLRERVRIPGLYSLAVNHVDTTLVTDDKQQSQQVLLMEFNGAVRAGDVSKRVHAWVLPPDGPKARFSSADDPYRWSKSEVSEAVLKRATALPLTITPTMEDYQPLQSFRFHAQPGQQIYVRIDKGLTSFGGYILGQPEARVVTVPDYPKLLRFVGSGSLLAMSGDKRVSVVSRNLPGMTLRIGQVLPSQLQYLVSFNWGNYSHPQLSDSFSENHIVERFVVRNALPDDPEKVSYNSVDLGQYLADGKRGVFLLHLSAYDPAAAKRAAKAAARECAAAKELLAPPAHSASGASDGTARLPGVPACDPADADAGDLSDGPTDNRLIVVTDLGLLVKKAEDGSQDVFVQSIGKGNPVSDATVAVVGLNGQTLLSRQTGADGTVHFAMPRRLRP